MKTLFDPIRESEEKLELSQNVGHWTHRKTSDHER